ncbi:uncharacterized protein UV8b_07854 [Ustilaginoidea virens]|uniref:Uncharacterized protein n=1 Tax=Ustilaginoidea virens TaxID=1159556 RepID=A0A063C5C5_USTVR|nr:uncharacterized protein UV8b_07854 [Ustilaginoidea virens]QUC23613.1 hypothetical protein UV8b_07854 [Ustilaginoidea virens]GAO17551.1 hypothetical protein UVI_02003180 [Ustilaginoidea virens]
MLASLALLAPHASGFFLTLSNFQPVSAASLPLECVFAYNTPMRGCGARDFAGGGGGGGGGCSPMCRGAVATTQAGIQEACALVSAGAGSLLGRAQSGNLVAALCGDDRPHEASARATGTASPVPPRTAARTRADSSPTRASSATAATTSGTWTSPSSLGGLASRSQGSTAQDTSAATFASPSSIRAAARPTQTQPQPQPPPQGGGGSPFDVFAPGRGVRGVRGVCEPGCGHALLGLVLDGD